MQLSQRAEYQAADIGFQLMLAAGYDPRAGLRIYKKLDRLSSKKPGILGRVFSTHPPADKRVQKLRQKYVDVTLDRSSLMLSPEASKFVLQ